MVRSVHNEMVTAFIGPNPPPVQQVLPKHSVDLPHDLFPSNPSAANPANDDQLSPLGQDLPFGILSDPFWFTPILSAVPLDKVPNTGASPKYPAVVQDNDSPFQSTESPPASIEPILALEALDSRAPTRFRKGMPGIEFTGNWRLVSALFL